MDFEIKEFEKVSSTQEIAKNLKEPKPWTVILAKEQSEGYGRKRNFWYSPRGGLYFSVILPKAKIEDLQILTFFAAFCVAKVIFEKLGIKIFIKFPNDLYLSGKKIGGVLIENKISENGDVLFSVLGIGLNTNIESFPPELKEKATSLFIELKKKISNKEILEDILKEIKNSFLSLS